MAISATAMYLGLSAPAIADTEAYSRLELRNVQVFNNDTGTQLDVSDFSSLEFGESASASAVTSFAAGAATASADTLETALACSGNCGGITENDPAQQVSSNFGRGDTSTNGGAVISGLPGRDSFLDVLTVTEGRQNIAEGWTSGLSGTRNAAEFTLAEATTIRFDFDALAELFVKLEQPLIQTQASYAWSVTVVEIATGNEVFAWIPNGGAGGISGGTELSDPFPLNDARGQLSTGQNGTGLQNGRFSATVTLAGQTAYRWTIGHNSQVNTEVEGTPARLGDRVWEDRNANGIQDCSDTNNNGVIGDAGDTGPECDAGIPDIEVNLLAGDCSTPLGQQTTTNADGFYLFAPLEPGDYCVEFVRPADDFCLIDDILPGSPQFTEKNAGNDDAVDSDADTGTGVSDAVSLADGESNLTVDAGLYCPSKLGNMLIEDLNRNGIQDPGEPGIGGQEVQLIMCVDGAPGPVLDSTVTAPDGMYMFNPLEPGEYAVRFSKPDGTVFSPQNQGVDDAVDCDTDMDGLSQCVPLGTREYNDTVDACVNREQAGLGDRVWEDKNANGIQDPGEPGIGDVPVTLLDPGQDGDCNSGDEVPLDTTTTAANGLYQFLMLESGRYCVEFEKPDICNPDIEGESAFSPGNQGADDAADSDADTTTGQTGNIDLGPGEYDPTNDAGVYCPAKIGDRVWNDTDENGIQDGGEPGKEGVAVNLYDCGPDGIRGTADDGGPAGSTATDINGMYMFNPLPPGNYAIECVKPTGYLFSPQDQGSDDAVDSDADQTTGQTVCTNLESNEVDPTWDCGLYKPQEPGIDIEKATNGVDADDPNAGDAPQIAPGELVTWTYKVTNTGNVDLVNVLVIDDQGVLVVCPQDMLAAGAMMTCTASGVADDLVTTGFTTVPGVCGGFPDSPLYENRGTATGETLRGDFVEDDDPSHYCNPPGGGGQGCTPGFWKNPKKFVAWLNPPYAPSTPFADVFGVDAFDGKTLLGVLKLGGGGLEALGRHSVAALLNAATADVDYDYASPAEVIAAFNAAYLSGDADVIEDQKDVFDVFNNQGCPINGKSPPSNL